MNEVITIDAVKDRMVMVRGEAALLDRDVATLYGLETKAVNQAVRNNPDKFPAGYVIELAPDEVAVLRSKILTLEQHAGRGDDDRTQPGRFKDHA